MKTAAISFSQPRHFLIFALTWCNFANKGTKRHHLTMFLSLTIAVHHFITMLNHSNNELPRHFTSRDFAHVIYIFICNMELRDLPASVKHKMDQLTYMTKLTKIFSVAF